MKVWDYDRAYGGVLLPIYLFHNLIHRFIHNVSKMFLPIEGYFLGLLRP